MKRVNSVKKVPYVNYVILLLISFLLVTSISAQSPGGVSTGLSAWYKADALPAGNVTNWTNSGGALTVNLTDPSSPYAQSTNGGASSNNYFNYNQYVSFSGNSSSSQKNLYNTGSFQLMANDNVATSQSSFFGVYQKNSAATNNDAVVYWRPSTGNYGIQFRGWGRLAISSNIGSSSNACRDFSPDVAQTIIGYTGNRSSATSMVAQKNASVLTSAPLSNATGVTGISMGARLTGASPSFGEYFAGNSGEIIFYNATLSAADVTKVNTYLAIKYGITLTSNYVSASNTTIFNNVAPYNKNIIGIGRDDASALIQKQSHNIDDSVRVYKGTLNATNATNTEVFGANNSYIVTGANTGLLKSTIASTAEIPVVSPAMYSRLEREWKVTNTNFNGETFNMDVKLNSIFPCYSNISDLRLLVDDDGNFTNATVYAAGSGLSFSLSGTVLTITGINNTHIALNATKYITVGTINNKVPTVTIAPSTTNICAGTSVSFTASPTNSGTSPTYQWQVNGSNVGVGSTYSSSSLNNGDLVSVLLTSNDACVVTNTASSNVIPMTVISLVTPMVTNVVSSPTICAGTNVTFTATPSNGGASPIYQWQVNASNVGTNSSTFSSSTLNNGDVVTVILTSNITCVTSSTAIANIVTMTVTPVVTPLVSLAASSNSICAGNNISFTATPTNAGTAPVYQWQINNINVGINSPEFSSTTINNGDNISLIMTSNEICISSSTANSNTLAISVIPLVTPAVSIIADNDTICEGTLVNYTAMPINGGVNPSYQWQINGTNVGTDSPTFGSFTLNNGDGVSVILTSNAICVSPSTSSSNQATVTVYQIPTAAFTYSPGEPIVTGTEIQFTDQSSMSTAWNWSFNDLGYSSLQNPTFTFSLSGAYTVNFTINNGPCVASIYHTITIEDAGTYYIPNTFTPNGDALNDLFTIIGDGISESNFSMTIFNRWGGEIYNTTDVSLPWDGKNKDGQDVANGVYVYVINFKLNGSENMIKKAGNVNVLR